MKSLWKTKEANRFIARYKKEGKDIALRTYSARLIGSDPSLVLHGGGNTSVKTFIKDKLGKKTSVLCVKGSGWDLGAIEPEGHPAVKLDELIGLRSLKKLSDEDMVNLQRINMLDAKGPNPSVETLLHAFLPHKFIDHTHADLTLAILNQPNAHILCKKWTKGKLGIVPYIMPGFKLAKKAAEIYEKDSSVEGLLLLKHGIFTFGDTAKESYERMIKWVGSAERFIAQSKKKKLKKRTLDYKRNTKSIGIVSNIIRKHITINNQPLIVCHRQSKKIDQFVSSSEAATYSQIGTATPDHVIRTKRKPLYIKNSFNGDEVSFGREIKSSLDKYIEEYQHYLAKTCEKKRIKVTPLDPMPRIIIVPGFGIFAVGKTKKACQIALDIYEHTINIIEMSYRLGKYQPLDEMNLFDMEYWSLEQAKLGNAKDPEMAGQVVWISGAASGIGLATAIAFDKLGAHLFLTDINEKELKIAINHTPFNREVSYAKCDVTKKSDIRSSFDLCSSAFGGVDIVISNAGQAFTSAVDLMDEDLLRKSFEINFFSHQNVAKAAAEIFKRQNFGGALLFNASKSAFNPGADFGPYSLPKSSTIALTRQYAVELGNIGVRSNAVNADRIKTNLFTDKLIKSRAKARGLSINDYFKGNLLKKEVLASDVAQAFVYLALAKKTTGAIIPVDGGNAAAFPR